MIINAPTIILTLVIVTFGCYGGLLLVRKFALQIAQENYDAIMAIDQAEDEKRKKRERAADTAAASAFAQVEPLLTTSNASEVATSSAAAAGSSKPSVAAV